MFGSGAGFFGRPGARADPDYDLTRLKLPESFVETPDSSFVGVESLLGAITNAYNGKGRRAPGFE